MPSNNNYNLREIKNRLIKVRTSLLVSNPFFGLLLMHTFFGLDESIETACTNGEKILFGPNFINEIDDKELEFILLHEIMHIVLQHLTRMKDKDDPFISNIACDIVVNSNILYSNKMDLKSITIKKYGESMHLAPNKKEGYEYSAEEVYEMLIKKYKKDKDIEIPDKLKKNLLKQTFDNHSRWGESLKSDSFKDKWDNRIINAANSIDSKSRDNLPLSIQRAIDELKNPKLDWRIILHNFIEEDTNDYSFNPPDRRYDSSPFYLPDFNEPIEMVKNILFMVDTSGSMSDEEITEIFSEIKGAIDQFNGRLSGLLGFFDASVTKPKPFNDVDEFKVIKPIGGGGTSFDCIFEYVFKKMKDNLPSSIIILTDGFAPIPNERVRKNIPVLWIINNDIVTPSWGKVVRLK